MRNLTLVQVLCSRFWWAARDVAGAGLAIPVSGVSWGLRLVVSYAIAGFAPFPISRSVLKNAAFWDLTALGRGGLYSGGG